MSPTIPPVLVLAALAAALLWFAQGDLSRYRPFRAPDPRTARYRRWFAKAGLGFALPALAALALLGRTDALATIPSAFGPLAALLPRLNAGEIAASFLLGMAGGLLLVTLRTRRRAGRLPRMLGDVGPLMPRTRRELRWGAALALTAGVTEELMFRLALPLAATLVTGSAVAGFALATAAFGLLHRYQGWIGVIATALAGALFAAIYLATAQLWLAMVLHALVDLNGLVLRPVLGGAWRRRD